jgi:Na+-transporting NADH:ubiquinone oxidoreductase subunit NqrA
VSKQKVSSIGRTLRKGDLAKMVNVVVLEGRLVRDPELRKTAKGTPVVSFTIAQDSI